MRQDVLKQMQQMGQKCRCIRCREVKDQNELVKDAVLKVRQYTASGGIEYFISFETPDENTIFGFARLRIVKQRKLESADKSPTSEGMLKIRILHFFPSRLRTLRTMIM